MIKSIILLIILIFLNATFASAEIAVISMSSAKLKKLNNEGDKRARKLSDLTEQPARFLATIQVAITFAGLLQSAFAAENFADPLSAVIIESGIGVPQGVVKTVCIVVITMVLAYFNLVFGELVPKRLAMKKADEMALGMSHMLYGVAKVFRPIVWLLTVSTNGILRLLGINPNEEEDKVTEEEIRMMLIEGNEQGTILEEESNIIQNVFEFDDIEAQELCTHRRDTIMLGMNESEDEWASTIDENRHTFYPVYGKDADDVIGVLDTRDYYRLADRSKDNLKDKAIDKPLFVPEKMKANKVFGKMKESRTYFAVLLDEYGGFSGIVTLHDLVEAVLGEIEDEDENEAEDIRIENEGEWVIQGRAELDEVGKLLGVELPVEVYETFGGYICGIIGRVPNDGESFKCEDENLEIEVKGVEEHIIAQTRVRKKKK